MSGPLSNPFMFKAAAAADFYTHQIANSVRMSDSGNSTLKITAGTPTSSKTFTYSWWWKRWDVTSTATQSTNVFTAGTSGAAYSFWTFTNGSTPQANFNFTGGNFVDSRLTTNMLFRDPSAWYHCVLRFDSTQAASANRVRLYVNGVEPTYSSATVQTDLAQDEDVSFINESGVLQGWGGLSGKGTTAEGCDVYMAEIVFNDGQSYGPDSYGETKNGVWIPKDPSGLTFGNNGYWLKFTNASDLGEDFSGNNNDFTAANLATHDQMLDSPTFGSDSGGGNFCTLNPLNAYSVSESNLAEGNLHGEGGSSGNATGGNWRNLYATFEIPHSGSYYWEYIPSNTTYSSGGIQTMAARLQGNSHNTDFSFFQTGEYRYNGSGEADTSGISANDIVGVHVNDGEIKVYVNNSLDHTFTQQFVAGSHYFPTQIGSAIGYWNFGSDSSFAGQKTSGSAGAADSNGYGDFYYSPKGLALCSGNLATPAADPAGDDAGDGGGGPQNYFKALAYAGGTTGHVTGFQPDLVWTKRYTAAQSNAVWDSSRGITKVLNTDASNAEATSSGLTAFNSDGYDMGTYYNQSGDSYVSWSWKANGGTTTTNDASATGIGTIDSAYQVDTTTGFSIVTYTGTGSSGTLAHGLGAVPKFMIVKARSASGTTWAVYAGAAGNGFLEIDNAAAYNSGTWAFDNTDPTSSVFTVNSGLSGSGTTYVAYLFIEKEGFSRFGSYEGNGNADGTFVYCGFRPAFIMTKSLDSTSDWSIFDIKREGYNVDNDELHANDGDAEGTSDMIDIYSNGFKSRIATDPNVAETYVFMAMADNPFKYATAR